VGEATSVASLPVAVVAVVAFSEKTQKDVAQPAWSSDGHNVGNGEFKARHVQAKIIERFLAALAAEDMSLFIVVADKEVSRPARGEDLYGS
jgi:hypothetical protein